MHIIWMYWNPPPPFVHASPRWAHTQTRSYRYIPKSLRSLQLGATIKTVVAFVTILKRIQSDWSRHIQSRGQILFIKRARTSAWLLLLWAPTVRVRHVCVRCDAGAGTLGDNNLRMCVLPEQIISELTSFHQNRGRSTLWRTPVTSLTSACVSAPHRSHISPSWRRGTSKSLYSNKEQWHNGCF